jgi:tetratricopeptide (TPR) repeat protein
VFAMPPPPPQQQPLSVAATDHPLSAMNVDHQPSPPYQSMSPSGAGMGVAATASAQLGSSPSAVPTAKKNTMNEAPFLSTTPTPVMSKPVPKIASAPLSPTQSLDTLADSFFEGSASRPAPLPLTQTDLERVRILVERRAWGDVLSMTANLLRGSSSHYTPIYAALLNSPDKSFPSLDSHQNELVELIMLQCHAWIKMRRYNELALEISRWSFCHHLDDDDGKKKAAPSWIPWSLHILAAASLQYTDMKNRDAATDALWKIRTMIMSSGTPDDDSSGSNSSSSRPLDILCVEHALCNAFVRKKEWRMALECLDRMIRHLPEATKLEVEKSSSSNEDAGNKENAAAVLKTAYQCECYSRQGRILLQVGALEEASQIFQRATLVWKQSSSGSIIIPALVANHPAIEQVPAQLQANDGLLSFAYNKYDGALESFRNAVNLMKQSDTSTLTVDGTYRTVRLLCFCNIVLFL